MCNHKRTFSLLCGILLLFLGACEIAETPQDTALSHLASCFEVSLEQYGCSVEELYDDYSFHGDGMALYKINLEAAADGAFEQWEPLPLSAEAADLLESVSFYIEFPEIDGGVWNLVDRGGTEQYSVNASLCVYDQDNRVAYLLTVDT